MKTIFAKEKSEYLYRLLKVINYNLREDERKINYQRMQELEKIVKDKDDELQIIITTVKTNNIQSAPPMTMTDIKKLNEDT